MTRCSLTPLLPFRTLEEEEEEGPPSPPFFLSPACPVAAAGAAFDMHSATAAAAAAAAAAALPTSSGGWVDSDPLKEGKRMEEEKKGKVGHKGSEKEKEEGWLSEGVSAETPQRVGKGEVRSAWRGKKEGRDIPSIPSECWVGCPMLNEEIWESIE